MGDGQAACAICHTRRPRRYCPGVVGHICPVCCGTERENTVSCPLDCPFLREARLREPDLEIDPRAFPNLDIRVDESFLQRNEPLLLLIATAIAQAALAGEGRAIDLDVREVLEGLVTKWRMMQSGLYAGTDHVNPIASRIREAVDKRLQEIDEDLTKNGSVLRGSDVLGVLAFLQRMEIQKNNGRKKSRAFIDFLREFFGPDPVGPPEEPELPPSRLILP